jgi:hypothetical protein
MNLVYTTKALTGWEGPGVCQHMSYFGDKIAFMGDGVVSNMKTAVESQGNLICDSFVKGFVDQHLTMLEAANWREIYDKLDVSYLAEYDSYCIVGGLHYPNSGMTRRGRRTRTFPNDRGQTKFMSNAYRMANILGIVKASNTFNVPINHVCFDPDEYTPDLLLDIAPKNITKYHGYDIPRYNIKRLDTLQKYLNKRCKVTLFETDKILDFVFGYTVDIKSGRDHYPDYINKLAGKFNSSKVFCRHYATGENTLVPKALYTEFVKESKYTFMIPSYDSTCFSIYRFIESLAEDCLPLIHPDVNLSEVSVSFNYDLSRLVRVEPFEDDEYYEVLQELKDKFLFLR